MEIKIIKFSVIILLFLISIISKSQTVINKIKYMKRYAYCSCIYINNNKLDENYLMNKFQINDKSSSLFIDLGKISENESEKIRKFTKKHTQDFTNFESSYHSESGKSNVLTSMCLDFYESKELDNYIKKILNINLKKNN